VVMMRLSRNMFGMSLVIGSILLNRVLIYMIGMSVLLGLGLLLLFGNRRVFLAFLTKLQK